MLALSMPTTSIKETRGYLITMRENLFFRGLIWLVRIAAAVILVGSAASVIASDQWWIRIWDFPRIQFAIALLLGGIFLWWFDRRAMRWLPLVMAICACWQFYRIFPYTPLAQAEVSLADAADLNRSSCFSVLSFNVLQENRDYPATIAMLEREDPDILLLLETDQAWLDALEPTLSTYPSRLSRPLDNKYGMALASRFPMRDGMIQDLAEPDTPSVYATLDATPSFRLIGLHPRPPRPEQDTDERDAELVIAARHAAAQSIPVLAIGDFNDVAWSDTSSLFKRLGALLDPRIGRGPFATYPADKTWLGWPLDHVFVTEEFLLQEIRVLKNVGSDHRPIVARLCLTPQKAPALNDEPTAPDGNDRSNAREIIDEFEQDARKDTVDGD